MSAGSGFSLVVAMDRNRGIGRDGGLPWKLSGDMRFFRELTTCPDRTAVEKRWGLRPEESAAIHTWGEVLATLKFAQKLPEPSDDRRNAVIMGRKTWESLPEAYRPLPGRRNAVISRSGFDPGLIEVPVHDSLDATLVGAGENFVIGGAAVYATALKHAACSHLYVTEIDAVFPCDTLFPEAPGFSPAVASPWIEENGVRYRFRRFDRIR